MTSSGPDAIDLLRRRVINVVGHELRTPLTTLRGLADLLEDASEGELRSELIPAVVRNAARAEQLLDDLLLAAEVTTVRPVESPEPVDVDTVVAAAVADTDVTVDGPSGATVLGRPSGIERALRHLVDNARIHGDGPSTVSVELDGDHVVVNLRTPIDRPIPDLDLAFELFFRGEEAVIRAAGLGIGLPVARALARLDGGDVDIDQADGLVTSRLRLPRAS